MGHMQKYDVYVRGVCVCACLCVCVCVCALKSLLALHLAFVSGRLNVIEVHGIEVEDLEEPVFFFFK